MDEKLMTKPGEIIRKTVFSIPDVAIDAATGMIVSLSSHPEMAIFGLATAKKFPENRLDNTEQMC